MFIKVVITFDLSIPDQQADWFWCPTCRLDLPEEALKAAVSFANSAVLNALGLSGIPDIYALSSLRSSPTHKRRAEEKGYIDSDDAKAHKEAKGSTATPPPSSSGHRLPSPLRPQLPQHRLPESFRSIPSPNYL